MVRGPVLLLLSREAIKQTPRRHFSQDAYVSNKKRERNRKRTVIRCSRRPELPLTRFSTFARGRGRHGTKSTLLFATRLFLVESSRR